MYCVIRIYYYICVSLNDNDMVTIKINNSKQENEALESFASNEIRWSTSVYATDFKPSLTPDFSGFPYNITLNSNQITY